MRFYFILIFLCTSAISLCQDNNYPLKDIPQELLVGVNSVLRYEEHIVDIPNQSTININHSRIVTVLNKRGNNDVEAYKYYDDVSRIKSATAIIYDALGNELKKFKQRDFKDASAVDGGSLYTDSRVSYLDYTPTSYPYTVVFNSETTSKNTVSIPDFYANEGYYSSTQKKYLEVNYVPELGLKFKSYGEAAAIVIKESPGTLKITLANSTAITPEDFSPGFRNIVGRISIALNDFHLEGVDGDARDWNTFGKWMNDNLLAGTQELPEITKNEVIELVKNLQDPIDKARAIYNFVQEKTRYVSVQVGIGGWKPMMASQVDKLGYGDCKALTNYTKALLEVVGVPSYYTVLYGSSEKRNIETDFTAIQGNHVILSLPRDDDEYIWLECTDQNVPFGFIAGFTDDRDVLVIKPNGGEVVHTKKYSPTDNFQTMKGQYELDELGNITGTILIKSGGLQYGDRFRLEQESDDDKKDHYYKFWGYLNNLNFSDILLENDKDKSVFTESIKLEAESYAAFAGEEMLVPINFFNRYTSLPERNKKRNMPITISRGFRDSEEIDIIIPEGFEIVALPENVTINTDFGSYSYSLKEVNDTLISYRRTFEFYEGTYDKEKYGDFRSFIRMVIRNDQQKLVIKKS